MTDGPGSALRPIYCIAVKGRDGDGGVSDVATLSSRVHGSAKEAAK